MLHLLPLDTGGLRALEAEWDGWFADNDVLFESYRPYLEHAGRLCAQNPADTQEGIYQLLDEEGTLSSEALVKIIHDKAKSEGQAVWNVRHPKYETDPPSIGASGYLTMSLIKEAIVLSKDGMHAQSLRVHMHNAIDRDWVDVIASGWSETKALTVFGNWLYIGDVTEPVELPIIKP